MNLRYNFNLSGSARKPLVEAMSQILGQPAVYHGAPNFCYTVGEYTLDRNGVLICGNVTHAHICVLIGALRGRGFTSEAMGHGTAQEESSAGGDAEEYYSTTEEPSEIDRVAVEVPDADFTPLARENLRKIVASKAPLLKLALGVDELPIAELDGKIAFPWFTFQGLSDEADTYSRLIAAICKMAKEQKRVTAAEKPVENAKYEMRLFLIRLGFIGDEYKNARKVLLRHLGGNSSWKSGHKPEPSGTDDKEDVSEHKNEEGEHYGE